MKPTITEEIIIRSIRKTTTHEELAILNKWLKDDNKNTICYFQLEEIWNSKDNLPDETIQKGWMMLAEQIDAYHERKQLFDHSTKKLKNSWFGYVAAVLIGILISSTIWTTMFNSTKRLPDSLIQNVVYNYSGVQSIILPDQSEVWLNENSRIVYPEEFAGEKRLVSLEGKAYFDIHKDLEKPFVVQIDEIEIEVVGTEFFVETTSTRVSSITLISGMVKLNYTNKEGTSFTTSLVPGEQAIVENGNISIKNIDTDYYIAWKDGTYRFTDDPLEKIIPLLAKHFDLDIHLAPSLSNKRFTGRVVPGEDIENVLQSFSKSFPIKYTITENGVEITE